MSPSLDLAETDASIISTIPKKISRRQSSSKFSNCVENGILPSSDSPIKGEDILFETTDSERKMGTDCALDMDQDIKTPENKLKTIDIERSKDNESVPVIVAGCRPKIKTKPIIIPKSQESKNLLHESSDNFTPLKTRYSFSNTSTQENNLSSTLPRNRPGMTGSVESRYNRGNYIYIKCYMNTLCNVFIQNGISVILSDTWFLTDLASSDDIQEFEECNEIDDEYEKVNNPLSYHLKQHFRMRRRQRSERGLSFNESNSQQYNNQQSDNEKVCLVTCLVVQNEWKI